MKDQYHTKTIFTEIRLNPLAPQEKSWFFSSYSAYELKKKRIRNPMIATNSRLLSWSLPRYGKQTDTIKMADFKGKLVMMEFWIKNCGYCMEAFPHLKELQAKYGKQIEILSINAYEKKNEIDFFYKREKPVYKMLYNGEKLAESLGIYAYPATLIVDETGKVIYSSSGFDKEAVEKIIKENLHLAGL
ncbi:MAG: TlpA family protein disulfide reductase [Chitinophagaceae bacterium]|nr:MAG: TlpA family protein disulfide reductase [Chitinophagaceae bacterium]